jgi:hypothetical protein
MAKFSDLPIEQTKEIIDYERQSRRSASDLASQYTQGLDSVADSIPAGPQIKSQNGGIQEALERKILGRQRQDMKLLKDNVQLEAVNDRFKRLQSAAMLTSQEHAYNEQARAARAAQRQNRKRARGAVLGNVLGIAGAVAGGIATAPMGGIGAAAGAGIGYQVGQGTGNLVGGGM